MEMKVGSVVKENKLWYETTSYTDTNGATVENPPECEMTVEEIRGNHFMGVWFDSEQQLHRKPFPKKWFEVVR